MIVRPGIDLVECERIANSISRHGEAFLVRVFTAGERAYCQDHAQSPQRYAARWAAKEAVAKALGCGIGEGASLVEIEVVRDDRGQPGIKLHGSAAATAEAMGVLDIRLSLTHTENYAAAFALVTTASVSC